MSVKDVIYQFYPATWTKQPDSKCAFEAMKQHLARIRRLGASVVWLSPFYPTGPDLHGGYGCDGGYDVANYCAVDARFGTLDDFDDFVAEAKRLGIKVIIDLVLNHTSTAHPWFQASRQGESKYKDYYLWSKKDLGWNNQFNGGSAFEFDMKRGEYYLHLFHQNQADLNWKNHDVMLEFQKIINFWTQKHGVDGFRLDVPIFIAKRFTRTWVPRCFGMFAGLSHYCMLREGRVIFHQLFDRRNLFVVAESGAPVRWMFDRMFAEKDPAITMAFNAYLPNFINKHFGMIPAKCSPKRWEKAMQRWCRDPYLVATVESHDLPRFTSRSGKSPRWIFARMTEANPQTICIYQGQELGMENPSLSRDILNYQDAQTWMRYERMTEKKFGQTDLKNRNSRIYEAKLRQYRDVHPLITTEIWKESRDNARVALDLKEYARQMRDSESVWYFYQSQIIKWRKM